MTQPIIVVSVFFSIPSFQLAEGKQSRLIAKFAYSLGFRVYTARGWSADDFKLDVATSEDQRFYVSYTVV